MRRLLNCLLVLAALLLLSGFGPLAHVARADSSVTVSTAILNVRAGPGTSYRVVNRVTAGTELAVQATSAAGDWLKVQAPGGITGWVSSLYVSTGPATPAAPEDATIPLRIVAPSIGLDSRIVPSGWHTVQNADGSTGSVWDVPAYAAGWLITSSRPGEPGNAVLAGHHNIEGEVFRYAVNLNAGDAITIYNGQGAIQYKVVDRFILADKYVSFEQRVANARWIGQFDDERLTLVTCWPYTNNTHRVIVIARPIGR